ncbi:MAG TPA: NAD(P)/FAD-dependent oxidoreductase [Steroidobacteraceae bacterium]|jgi:glutathione reductase (NADPH)|nr:NAD(P)/FAD-dependent oxidoreductase [Steroidobacteraceae bacterium]
MSHRYDLVIIGTGAAAGAAATPVRSAGWNVAIIDHRPFGGTCALRGCDPKRVLAGAAETIAGLRRMHGRGIEGGSEIDWRELLAFKRTFTDPIPQQRATSYAERGIDTFHGRARFTGRSTLAVDGNVLEGRHFLIAAGAEPITLDIPGEEYLATHEEFLSLEQLPRRLALVGGGYIAAEFSHIAARAGAQVTVLQRGERLLEHFDPDLVGWLTEAFRLIGVEVRTHTAVEAIEKIGSVHRVRARTGSGPITLEADCVIHAAGRAPALDALDLQAGGIAVEHGKLALNEFLQSVSNPAVYAAGDAAGAGPPLTPVAARDGALVAANLLEGNRHRPSYVGVPSVAFTVPPIAAVGLTEAAARERGLDVRVSCRKASDWYTARRVAEPVYGFKILIEANGGRILGAHLVGPAAEEVINLFALAIRQGMTAEELKAAIFAYPTGASDIGSML